MPDPITLGSDPEVHILDNDRKRIVSSIPVLRRDKHNPHLLPGGVKLYADNVLAEFSHPPFANSEQAVVGFRRIFGDIQGFLGTRYGLVPQAAHTYGPEDLGKKDPEASAWKAGCDPNLNPYIEGVNPKVTFNDGVRTGSFHIHVGHPKLETLWEKGDFIKLMDIYLGCSSILFDKDETNAVRRRYYGRAGEFRPTDYGVEYRVLGNFALRHPELVRLVFDLASYCATHIDNGTVKDVISLKDIQMHAQHAINLNHAAAAYKVIDKAGLPSRLLKRVTDRYEFVPFTNAWGIN